jgi:hypothetical protein
MLGNVDSDAVSHRNAVLGSNHRILIGFHTPDKAKGPGKQGLLFIGGEGGIRTLDGLLTHTPLAGARLQPLGHLSNKTVCSALCPGGYSNTGRDYSACRPRPFGAAVASRRRCLAPAALGSNPRWAINPYALSRGAPSATRPPLQIKLFVLLCVPAATQTPVGITRPVGLAPSGPPSLRDDVVSRLRRSARTLAGLFTHIPGNKRELNHPHGKIARRDYNGIRMPIHKKLPAAGLFRSGLIRVSANPVKPSMNPVPGYVSCCPAPALP